MTHFLNGLAIGVIIAVPVGPVGALCLKRTLRDGRAAGLVSGLGAATADALYGFVAAFGLTFITDELVAHRRPLQLIGGAFLIFLGLKTLLGKPARIGERGVHVARLSRAFFSTFALTLTNPITIVSFLGIFAGFGMGASGNLGVLPACWLVLGVFLGSAFWWLLLSSGAAWLGRRLDHGGAHVIQICVGAGIAIFGVWQLVQFFIQRSA
jgi:threonine/homoserine/homoserine lactone efflux protein